MRMHTTGRGSEPPAEFAPMAARTGWAVLLLAATAACGGGAVAPVAGEAAVQDGSCPRPLETRTREVPTQQPTRADQTRACETTTNAPVEVAVVTDDLHSPWAVQPLPDGALLVTEKAGRMRIVTATGEVSDAIAGVPRVDSAGQGGLLDVVLGPDSPATASSTGASANHATAATAPASAEPLCQTIAAASTTCASCSDRSRPMTATNTSDRACCLVQTACCT